MNYNKFSQCGVEFLDELYKFFYKNLKKNYDIYDIFKIEDEILDAFFRVEKNEEIFNKNKNFSNQFARIFEAYFLSLLAEEFDCINIGSVIPDSSEKQIAGYDALLFSKKENKLVFGETKSSMNSSFNTLYDEASSDIIKRSKNGGLRNHLFRTKNNLQYLKKSPEMDLILNNQIEDDLDYLLDKLKDKEVIHNEDEEQKKLYKKHIFVLCIAFWRIGVVEYKKKDLHNETITKYKELKNKPFDIKLIQIFDTKEKFIRHFKDFFRW